MNKLKSADQIDQETQFILNDAAMSRQLKFTRVITLLGEAIRALKEAEDLA